VRNIETLSEHTDMVRKVSKPPWVESGKRCQEQQERLP